MILRQTTLLAILAFSFTELEGMRAAAQSAAPPGAPFTYRLYGRDVTTDIKDGVPVLLVHDDLGCLTMTNEDFLVARQVGDSVTLNVAKAADVLAVAEPVDVSWDAPYVATFRSIHDVVSALRRFADITRIHPAAFEDVRDGIHHAAGRGNEALFWLQSIANGLGVTAPRPVPSSALPLDYAGIPVAPEIWPGPDGRPKTQQGDELEETRKAATKWHDDYVNACRTMALMHAAAFGGGPDGEFQAKRSAMLAVWAGGKEDGTPVDDIAALYNEYVRAKEEYSGVCKTMAEMHAAAVGEIRGPDVGLVEDVAALRAACLAAKEGIERAWGIIANAGQGDWTNRETPEWVQAAITWRDKYVTFKETPPAMDLPPAEVAASIAEFKEPQPVAQPVAVAVESTPAEPGVIHEAYVAENAVATNAETESARGPETIVETATDPNAPPVQ